MIGVVLVIALVLVTNSKRAPLRLRLWAAGSFAALTWFGFAQATADLRLFSAVLTMVGAMLWTALWADLRHEQLRRRVMP